MAHLCDLFTIDRDRLTGEKQEETKKYIVRKIYARSMIHVELSE